MNNLSASDSNAVLTEVMKQILLIALDRHLEAPFVVKVTDGRGQVMSYTLSEDLTFTPLEGHEIVTMFYPFSIGLADTKKRFLKFTITQPERTH